MVTCDEFEWPSLVTARNSSRNHCQSEYGQVQQTIDKIGTVVRIKRIVLMHRKRRASLWRFTMQNCMVPNNVLPH